MCTYHGWIEHKILNEFIFFLNEIRTFKNDLSLFEINNTTDNMIIIISMILFVIANTILILEGSTLHSFYNIKAYYAFSCRIWPCMQFWNISIILDTNNKKPVCATYGTICSKGLIINK